MIKTIASTELPIGEQLMIRKNVIGYGGGKRLCIVTGTHGDELEGQMVCYEMARRLGQDLRSLDGTVEIYPALNPLGIDTMMRGIPNFDLDMNRIFPGNPGGTMIEQAAYAIVEDLKGADLVIDVHSSNIYLRETPQVRINVNDEQRLVPIAQQMGIEFVWIQAAWRAGAVCWSACLWSLSRARCSAGWALPATGSCLPSAPTPSCTRARLWRAYLSCKPMLSRRQ